MQAIGLRWVSFLLLAGLLAWTPAQARTAAGKITLLEGRAWVTEGDYRSPLQAGSIVYEGDRIYTGEDSRLHIRFLDQTFFALGADASFTLDRYDEREEAEESFVASVLNGAFRFVSGLLAKTEPRKVEVQLTVATIGVRGTDVAGEVRERRGDVESSASVILLEDEQGETGAIEVSNQYGSVFIDRAGYGTEIPDEHSAPSPVRRMQIRTIDNLLRAIRNSTRGTIQRKQIQ